MPAYPIDHITVILRIACAREQATFNRKGMDVLAEEIDDQYEPAAEYISTKYLDEHLLKPIIKAHETGNKTVNLGSGKLNKLCDFIGFRDYEGFCQAWAQIDQFINHDSLTQGQRLFKCIYEITDEENVNMQCKGAPYPEQQLNLASPLLLAPTDVKTLEKALNTETGIAIVGYAWLEGDFTSLWTNWFATTKNPGRLCPVWNMNVKEAKKLLPSVPMNRILSAEPYFHLIFQRFQYIMEQGSSSTHGKKDQQSTINITDSGAVFTGNPTISGKYISSRDMTINIKNDSDNG